MQIVGIVVFVLTGGLWMLDVPADLQQLQWSRLFAGAAVGVLLLLVTTSWIPWAVTQLWSAPLLAATWRLWVAVSLILWPFSVGVRVVDALMRRVVTHHVALVTADAGLGIDVGDDVVVAFSDLLIVLSTWGPCPADCPADIDGSGAVDFPDLLAVLSTWGMCP